MTEIRKADPVARRRAILLVVAGAVVGALLIFAFERYRVPLRDWLLAEPGDVANRARLLLLLSAAILSTPLLAFAVYLWALGEKILRAREFPPPGFPVIRDTPVVTGQTAVSRGLAFKILGLCLAVACAVIWLLFWRLA